MEAKPASSAAPSVISGANGAEGPIFFARKPPVIHGELQPMRSHPDRAPAYAREPGRSFLCFFVLHACLAQLALVVIVQGDYERVGRVVEREKLQVRLQGEP